MVVEVVPLDFGVEDDAATADEGGLLWFSPPAPPASLAPPPPPPPSAPRCFPDARLAILETLLMEMTGVWAAAMREEGVASDRMRETVL